jgi:hypothetical protein
MSNYGMAGQRPLTGTERLPAPGSARQGRWDDRGIHRSAFTGSSRTPQPNVPGVATSMGAGPGSHDGTATVAWQGSRGDQGIHWSSFNAVSRSPQQPIGGVGTSPDLLAAAG